MECETHDKSLTDDDKRQTLSTLVSWHTILSAAKSWNHAPVMQIILL